MNPKIRTSIWSRLVALGFIYQIILGNIWFVQALTTKQANPMMYTLFGVGMIWVIVFGIAWLAHFFYLWKMGDLHEPEGEHSED